MGNLIGPQTFRASQAPTYTGGVVAMLSCYCICILLINAYWALCAWFNRRKDMLYGKPASFEGGSVEELMDGFHDLTDKEQKDFRYTT